MSYDSFNLPSSESVAEKLKVGWFEDVFVDVPVFDALMLRLFQEGHRMRQRARR